MRQHHCQLRVLVTPQSLLIYNDWLGRYVECKLWVESWLHWLAAARLTRCTFAKKKQESKFTLFKLDTAHVINVLNLGEASFSESTQDPTSRLSTWLNVPWPQETRLVDTLWPLWHGQDAFLCDRRFIVRIWFAAVRRGTFLRCRCVCTCRVLPPKSTWI